MTSDETCKCGGRRGQALVGSRLRCLLCNYGAETDSAMDAHMRAIHPDPRGVTASPAYAEQLAGFAAYQAKMADAAKASIAAREVRERIAFGEQAVGEVFGQQTAQARTFTREEVLTVLKAHIALATARPPEMNERDAIRALITIFERME